MAQGDSLIGKVIGSYEVQRELGRGGMGVVYKAHEQSLQRVVALKVLPPHLASDPQFVKRFEREARAVASLTHPNIVTIFAVGSHEDHHFMAMEYVKGSTIDQVIRERGKFNVRDAVEIIQQAADALAEAHRNDIIHRDIKPHNIMLDQAGRVKVMDFGLAKLMSGRTEITATGTYMGTPSYMSPEQCQGQDLDPRTDIYSLGIMLYEMLAGTPPFKAETPLAVMRKILDDPMPSLVASAPSVPAEVETILAKMTAKDMNARYASASDISADLKAWLRGDPTSLASQDAATLPADSGKQSGALRQDKTVISGQGLADTRSPSEIRAALPKKGPNVAVALAGAAVVMACIMAVIAGGAYFAWDAFQKQNTSVANQTEPPVSTPETETLPDAEVTEMDEEPPAETPDTLEEETPEPAPLTVSDATAKVAEEAAASIREQLEARIGEVDAAAFAQADGLFKDGQAYRHLGSYMEAVTAFDAALAQFNTAYAALPEMEETEPIEEAVEETKEEPAKMEVAANTKPSAVLPEKLEYTHPAPAPKPEPKAEPPAPSGPREYAGGRFVDNGDGTITDTQSGLLWQKADSGAMPGPRIGRDSDYRTYVDGLRLGGRASWRVPTKAELMRLGVDGYSASDLPFKNSSQYYWCYMPGQGQDHGVCDWGQVSFFISPKDANERFAVRAVTGP